MLPDAVKKDTCSTPNRALILSPHVFSSHKFLSPDFILLIKIKAAAVHNGGIHSVGRLNKLKKMKHLGSTRCHLLDKLQNLQNINYLEKYRFSLPFNTKKPLGNPLQLLPSSQLFFFLLKLKSQLKLPSAQKIKIIYII